MSVIKYDFDNLVETVNTFNAATQVVGAHAYYHAHPKKQEIKNVFTTMDTLGDTIKRNAKDMWRTWQTCERAWPSRSPQDNEKIRDYAELGFKECSPSVINYYTPEELSVELKGIIAALREVNEKFLVSQVGPAADLTAQKMTAITDGLEGIVEQMDREHSDSSPR